MNLKLLWKNKQSHGSFHLPKLLLKTQSEEPSSLDLSPHKDCRLAATIWILWGQQSGAALFSSLSHFLDADKYNRHKLKRICKSRYFNLKIAFILFWFYFEWLSVNLEADHLQLAHKIGPTPKWSLHGGSSPFVSGSERHILKKCTHYGLHLINCD